ncbi:ubiquinol oxidase subunit II [Paenibacillus antri]|nr:ubiquinol oxidase subunit II [Paenibacillus antri]
MLLLTAALLTGCGDAMVFDPKGPIAAQQKDLIYISMLLCVVILVPVLALTAYIVVRYRDRKDSDAPYEPTWSHNTKLEIVWWAIPIIIIAILAVVTVRYTHALEPSKPIVSEKEELVIQVTSLDWKWLFQYPEQDIATVNYLYIPEDVPVRFELTSDAPMNSFWIPQLGGQIYTMSGMAMTLYLQADEPGVYYGSGANFSGEHFADMTFFATAVPQDEFDAWVEQVKSTSEPLTVEGYDELRQPGTSHVQQFAGIPEGLFYDIVTRYVVDGQNPHAGHGASAPEAEEASDSADAAEHGHDESHAAH